MPFKITTKGRIKLKRAGSLISEHVQETEAFESAIRHAEANGSGVYTIEPPIRELDVSVLSRVIFNPDTTAPSVPGSVTVTALSTTTLRISWTASTDTGGSGLAGYRVLRATSSGGPFTQVGDDLTTASLSFDDTSMSEATTRYYRVVAFDGNGNVSSQSSTATGTTQATGGGSGTTYFATASGGSTSTSAGQQANPWTPAFAVTRLQAGDTLRLIPGNYTWSVTNYEGGAFNPTNNGTSSAQITIVSHIPREAIIRSGAPRQAPAIGLLRKNYITVKDMTVYGNVKARGNNDNTGDNPSMMRGIIFEGLEVFEGDIEGGDTSLHSGITTQWIRESIIRNCRVTNLGTFGNRGDNTSGISLFDSTDNIVEYNYVDGNNVHACYGFKAGHTSRNIMRFNFAANCRSGNGGSDGAGFYYKANTVFPSPSRWCDDNIAYQNIIWNCYRAFQQNHGCRRTKIYNNTARNVDWFYRQWQTNVLDTEMWNNICRGDGSTRFMEFEAGASSILATLLKKSNYNCSSNAGTDHCFIGGTSISLAAFPSSGLTTSVQGREANSISGNPLFVNDADDGDFHLQAGSPCRNAGEGGVSMGAYITGSERIGPDWI